MVLSDESRELPEAGELLAFVDDFLSSISGQSLVDSDFVQDFLLDLRNIINPDNSEEEL